MAAVVGYTNIVSVREKCTAYCDFKQNRVNLLQIIWWSKFNLSNKITFYRRYYQRFGCVNIYSGAVSGVTTCYCCMLNQTNGLLILFTKIQTPHYYYTTKKKYFITLNYVCNFLKKLLQIQNHCFHHTNSKMLPLETLTYAYRFTNTIIVLTIV